MVYKFNFSQYHNKMVLTFTEMFRDIDVEIGEERYCDFVSFMETIAEMIENPQNRKFRDGFDIDTLNMETVHFIFRAGGEISLFGRSGIKEFNIAPDDIANKIVDGIDVRLLDDCFADVEEKCLFMEAYLRLKNDVGKIKKYVEYDENLKTYECAFMFNGCQKQRCGDCGRCYGFQILINKAHEIESKKEIEEE